MVAVERIKEYSEIPMEFDNGISPPPTWPHAGAIAIAGLSIRYDPALPNVLHDLTFSVKGGERIAMAREFQLGLASLESGEHLKQLEAFLGKSKL